MPAPHSSAFFGSSKKKSTTLLVGDTRAVKMRKKSASEGGSVTNAGRVLIFFTHFPLETPFLKAAVRPRSLPLSLSHRGDSLTSTLLAMTSIHRPTTPRTRSYNLLFRTTFFLRTEKTAGLGERRVCLRHIGVRKSNSKQVHADILQLQLHIYKWREGAQLSAWCLI